jgi:hypothetical protein
MNIVKPRALSRNEFAFETDMAKLQRGKKSETSNNEGVEARVEVSTLVSRISSQSIQHVDDLIEGLHGIRKQLDDERDRLEHGIGSYAAFGQSVIDLANIVSEGMAAIKSPSTTSEADVVVSSSKDTSQ